MKDDRTSQVDHFNRVFQQLWEYARADYRESDTIGSSEPIVKFVRIPDDLLIQLAANPRDLANLSPDAFELFVADRLDAMGLGVHKVGRTNQADGGIDMLAWPKANAALPFLIAIQAKHSRIGRPVGPNHVRDLRGALSSIPVDIGLLVTNTRFTADAHWAATQGPKIVRLRDFDDLVRWIRSDFATQSVLRDLPADILLGPGLRIHIKQGMQSSA